MNVVTIIDRTDRAGWLMFYEGTASTAMVMPGSSLDLTLRNLGTTAATPAHSLPHEPRLRAPASQTRMIRMLDWKSDARLVIDGTQFMLNPIEFGREEAPGALVLYKERWMVERYAALRSEIDAANVFELGSYEGGSAALLALLFRPRRLVTVELKPSRAPALDDFIDAHDLHETVRPYYGVDQADRARLEEIVEHEYGSEPLDLVIDDASHLIRETTASFNVLFPRLRPGGLYVLEDWSGEHTVDAGLSEMLRSDEQMRQEWARRFEAGDLPIPSEDPVSRLVLQFVLTTAYARGVISEVMSVRPDWVVVRRGDAELDPHDFDISQSYGSLGRKVLREEGTVP